MGIDSIINGLDKQFKIGKPYFLMRIFFLASGLKLKFFHKINLNARLVRAYMGFALLYHRRRMQIVLEIYLNLRIFLCVLG